MTALGFITYLIYISVSVAMTIWVGNTLFKNGHVFLSESFGGDQDKAKAVNELLRVGFYLVNFGFVLLVMYLDKKPQNATEVIEFIAVKLGVVMLVLGGMHFFNMFNFDKIRRKSRLKLQEPKPDFQPDFRPSKHSELSEATV